METAERSQAQEERLEYLGHRLHLLEKHIDDVKERGWLGMCWDLFRSIPWLIVLAFNPCFFGIGMIMITRVEAKSAIDMLTYSNKAWADFSEHVGTFCTIAVVLDVLVLFAAIPAQGELRAYIFGRRHTGSLLLVQCLAGPCVLCLLGLMLVVIFFLLFRGIVATVPAATVLAVTHGVCMVDSAAARQGVAEALRDSSQFSDDLSLLNAALQKICQGYQEAILLRSGELPSSEPPEATDSMMAPAGIFTSGLVLAAFGHGCLIAAHANTYEMVMCQEDLEDDDNLVKELHNPRKKIFG